MRHFTVNAPDGGDCGALSVGGVRLAPTEAERRPPKARSLKGFASRRGFYAVAARRQTHMGFEKERAAGAVWKGPGPAAWQSRSIGGSAQGGDNEKD